MSSVSSLILLSWSVHVTVIESPRVNREVWVPVNVNPPYDDCVTYVVVAVGVSPLIVETAWTGGVVVL